MTVTHTNTSADQSPLTERAVFWFFVVAFLVLFAGYGLREPWPADEPRFVLVAKQMVESGQWLFPHRGIELYPDKPPVYFWLLALSYGLIGSWRWSFLLPSLLSGMAVLWLVFDLGKRLWQPRAGLWAAVAVLVSIQFMYQFKRAQIDPTLVCMTTASFYALARALLLDDSRRWLYLGFFLAGLGVITKGVGFLPLLALLPWALYRRLQFQPMRMATAGDRWRWLAAVGFFLLPIALWIAAIVYQAKLSGSPEQAEYLRNILFKQTAERYANPWHHHEPFWYFAEIIGLFWMPFSLTLFWLIRPWREAFHARDLRVVMPLVWALSIVVFFSLSAGKRDMYILPALPAFALAAAPFLQSISERAGFRRLLWVFLLLLGAALLGLGIAAEYGSAAFARNLVESRGLGAEARWLWHVLVVCGAVMLGCALLLRIRRVLAAAAIGLSVLWCSYGFVLHPVLDASSSSKALMQRAADVAGPGREIGLVAWKEQNLLQASAAVTDFGFRQTPRVQLQRGMQWLAEKPEQRRLLINQIPALDCVAYGAAGTVSLDKANRRSWWLVDARALSACR